MHRLGEKPYKCQICNRGFSQAQQLKYHTHSAHGGAPRFKRNQKLNSVIHTNPVAIETNVNGIKATNENCLSPAATGRTLPYMCSQCNRSFKLPSSLTSHMKTHSEERKHVCPECGNTFKRAEHLRIHVNGVHLKQKPYPCYLCKKSFAQSGDRNIHMRRHTGKLIIRPIGRYESNLTFDNFILGEKPHQCTYCLKNFRLRKAMRAHMRIHVSSCCSILIRASLIWTIFAIYRRASARTDARSIDAIWIL